VLLSGLRLGGAGGAAPASSLALPKRRLGRFGEVPHMHDRIQGYSGRKPTKPPCQTSFLIIQRSVIYYYLYYFYLSLEREKLSALCT
jgi:hypothetical protein